MTKTAGLVTYPPHLARRQPGPSGEVSAPAAVSGAPVQKGFSAMNFRILAAPKAAPKAAPAAPAPAAQQAPPANGAPAAAAAQPPPEQQVQLIYAPWTK